MTEYSKKYINSFLIQANRDVGSHKYKGDQWNLSHIINIICNFIIMGRIL